MRPQRAREIEVVGATEARVAVAGHWGAVVVLFLDRFRRRDEARVAGFADPATVMINNIIKK